jgi:predicted esterase
LPGDWETSTTYQLAKTTVLHVAGERDEVYPPARVADYRERLQLRAADVEFRSYDAEHEITDSMREDIRDWLRAHANL